MRLGSMTKDLLLRSSVAALLPLLINPVAFLWARLSLALSELQLATIGSDRSSDQWQRAVAAYN